MRRIACKGTDVPLSDATMESKKLTWEILQSYIMHPDSKLRVGIYRCTSCMHVQCLFPYHSPLTLQQRCGCLIALRSLLHHCPLHSSLSLTSVQDFSLLFFLRGVYHKGQPVVGDDDAATCDKDVRIVSGLSLPAATSSTKKKGFCRRDKCQLDCAA